MMALDGQAEVGSLLPVQRLRVGRLQPCAVELAVQVRGPQLEGVEGTKGGLDKRLGARRLEKGRQQRLAQWLRLSINLRKLLLHLLHLLLMQWLVLHGLHGRWTRCTAFAASRGVPACSQAYTWLAAHVKQRFLVVGPQNLQTCQGPKFEKNEPAAKTPLTTGMAGRSC